MIAEIIRANRAVRSVVASKARFRRGFARLDFSKRALPAALAVLAALAALLFHYWRTPCDEVYCVVAFGDSLSAGTGLPAEEGFAHVLEGRLRADGYPARVVNAGVRGDTSGQGLARIETVLRLRPDLAIVEFGINDLVKEVAYATTRDNLSEIVARLQARGARVLLAGFRLCNSPFDMRMKLFDPIYLDVANERQVTLHPYFLRRLMEGHGKGRLQPDGGHPNALGVIELVDDVAPYVEREIDAVAKARRGEAVEAPARLVGTACQL